MKKIKAFTLSELLVVMVISAIVVSLSFLVLTMVQKQAKGIKQNINNKRNIENLDKLLWKDFNECNKAFLKNEDLFFYKNSDTIIYKIDKEGFIRKKDSFKIPYENLSFFLDGMKTIKDDVDALKIEFVNEFKNNSIFVFRKKDATYYLNN